MEHDERGGARAVGLRIGLDGGRVQHERFWLVPAQLLLRGSMNSVFANSACHGLYVTTRSDEPMSGIGACERIDDVDVLVVEEGDDLRAQPLEAVLLDRLVDRSPPSRSSEPGSLTTNLSSGERPVCSPVSTTSGPPSASYASPRSSAWLYSSDVVGFQYTTPDGASPWASRPDRARTSIPAVATIAGILLCLCPHA